MPLSPATPFGASPWDPPFAPADELPPTPSAVLRQEAVGTTGAGTGPLTCTLASPPLIGSLLVFCMAGDKLTGEVKLDGFEKLYQLLSTSVSLYFCWKVSNGTETAVSATWDLNSAVGNSGWYAEYTDATLPVLDNGSWVIAGQSSHITDESTALIWNTNTTGLIPSNGVAVAAAAIDSYQSVSPGGRAFDNGFKRRLEPVPAGGAGGLFTADRVAQQGERISTNFQWAAVVDQCSAAVVCFARVPLPATPAPPPPPLLMLQAPPGQNAPAPAFTIGLFPPSLGGTIFPQALTATVTTAASIVNSVGKLLSATATSTASLLKSIGKPLTATVTSTATLVALKVKTVAMSATVTTTASIIKSVGKPLSATSTTTASIVKQVGKTLSATVSSTATMLTIKAKNLVMTATVTTTASISRSVGKKLSATVTTSASITKQIAIRLSATVSSTASTVATFTGLSAVRTLFFGRNRPHGGIGQGSPGAGGFGQNRPHGGTGQGSPSAQEFGPPSPEERQ